MAWLAGYLVAGAVRVTRSGLVVNGRPLVQVASGVLHSKVRVTIGEVVVCRAGAVVYSWAIGSTHSEAYGQ